MEFKANRLSDLEKIDEVTKQMEDRVIFYKDRTRRTVEKQCDLTTKIQVTSHHPDFLKHFYSFRFNN